MRRGNFETIQEEAEDEENFHSVDEHPPSYSSNSRITGSVEEKKRKTNIKVDRVSRPEDILISIKSVNKLKLQESEEEMEENTEEISKEGEETLVTRLNEMFQTKKKKADLGSKRKIRRFSDMGKGNKKNMFYSNVINQNKSRANQIKSPKSHRGRGGSFHMIRKAQTPLARQLKSELKEPIPRKLFVSGRKQESLKRKSSSKKRKSLNKL